MCGTATEETWKYDSDKVVRSNSSIVGGGGGTSESNCVENGAGELQQELCGCDHEVGNVLRDPLVRVINAFCVHYSVVCVAVEKRLAQKVCHVGAPCKLQM